MGNEHRRVIKTGEEQDVHTPWRRLCISLGRPGATAKAKRRTRRRERRDGHVETDRQWRNEWHEASVRGWYDYIVDRALDGNPMSEAEAIKISRQCDEAWHWWAESRDA